MPAGTLTETMDMAVLRGAVLLACLLGFSAAGMAQEDKTLLDRCWSADALKVSAPEASPVHRRAGVDIAGLRQQALAPAVSLPDALKGSIRRVELPPGRKLLALTFDLCETSGEIAGYQGDIIDYLRANRIKATFFASGHWIATHPERAAQLIADPLFELAAHGWSHRDMRYLSANALREELLLSEAAYERARAALAGRACVAEAQADMGYIPARMPLFRFPYGTCNRAALDAVAEAGAVAVQWDVVTGDPAPGQSARAIAATVLHSAKPGSIIVAHANGRGWHTAAALPQFVPALQARGFEFATVSELLAAGQPVAADTCYENRPGDQPATLVRRLVPRPTETARRHAEWTRFAPND